VGFFLTYRRDVLKSGSNLNASPHGLKALNDEHLPFV
jgi:hypothetical protein